MTTKQALSLTTQSKRALVTHSLFNWRSALVAAGTVGGAIAAGTLWPGVVAVGAGLYVLNTTQTLKSDNALRKVMGKTYRRGFRSDIEAPDFDRKEAEVVLSELRRDAKALLPSDGAALVNKLTQELYKLLGFLESAPAMDPLAYKIKQTTLVYLPDTLDNYARLDPKLATIQKVRGTKTAYDLLKEQLWTLIYSLEVMKKKVHHQESQRMLVQERFLKERFAEERVRAPAPKKK